MFSPSKIGTKESGTVDGVYNYDFYYFPLSPELLEEVATRVAARRKKNAPNRACLGITKSVVKTYNTRPIVHMYGFIWDSAFPEDEASGAIQIGYDGVYITDLCRNFTKNQTDGPSPVKILMGKFDDIVKDELIMEKRLADDDMSIMGSLGKSTKTKSVKKAKRVSQTVTKTVTKTRGKIGGRTRRK